MVYRLVITALSLLFLYHTSTGDVRPNHPIRDALYLHNMSLANSTLRDCMFRPIGGQDTCPDPDIRFLLYVGSGNGSGDGDAEEGAAGGGGVGRHLVDHTQTDWLRQSPWDPTKEDVVLVHGYAGGDDILPMSVLKDAYVNNGSFNVWVVDWGALGPAPCYRAAVHNMRPVARCIGDFLTTLRSQGLRTDRLTCVGHSLGAHICGLISKYIYFRLHRVVGLDPARPLVSPGVRMSSASAAAVHVIHTNAGHYGESGRGGHVDFCVNGGRIQPYCEESGFDEQLCSHVWSVCYMAASIHPQLAQRAEPCSRRCPTGPRPGHKAGIPILMGQYTPTTASGSYCVREQYPPYCPKHSGGIGDVRCCLKAPEIVPPNNQSVETV